MTTQTQTPATTEAFVASLRQIADFFEAHSELPIDPSIDLNMYLFGFDEDLKLAQTIAEAMGTFKKDQDSSLFVIAKDFGNVHLRYIFNRSNVCAPRVVGTRKVKKYVRPDGWEETHMQEVDEDIVEWNCPTLLGDESEADELQP